MKVMSGAGAAAVAVGVGLPVAWNAYLNKNYTEVPSLTAGSVVAELMAEVPVASEPYAAPALPWALTQTLCRSLVTPAPELPYTREVLSLPDGGALALDWLDPEGTEAGDSTPIFFVLPGLSGTSQESYVTSLLTRLPFYRRLVMNNRGNAGVPLRTAQTYSGAYTDDLLFVLAQVRERYPAAKVFAVGFSLGGLILSNYLSKQGRAGLDPVVCGALVVSSPWNPLEASDSLERFPFRLVFNRYLAGKIVELAEANRDVFKDRCDWKRIHASRTIRQFDEAYIVPLFGYKDVQEYYRDAGVTEKTGDYTVPVLFLNAADDPFAPLSSIPLHKVPENPNCGVLVTHVGGHVAFLRSMRSSEPGLVHLLAPQWAAAVINRANAPPKA